MLNWKNHSCYLVQDIIMKKKKKKKNENYPIPQKNHQIYDD